MHQIHVLRDVSLICEVFYALIRCIEYIKRPAKHYGTVDVILLHSGHRHVSASPMAIFRVARTIIHKYN